MNNFVFFKNALVVSNLIKRSFLLGTYRHKGKPTRILKKEGFKLVYQANQVPRKKFIKI